MRNSRRYTGSAVKMCRKLNRKYRFSHRNADSGEYLRENMKGIGKLN